MPKRVVPFTPGPWRTGKGGADRVYVDRGAGSYPIAQVMSRPGASAGEALLDVKSEEDFANARLMAAAPDLLLACQMALGSFVPNEHSPAQQSAYRRLADAIKLAVYQTEA